MGASGFVATISLSPKLGNKGVYEHFGPPFLDPQIVGSPCNKDPNKARKPPTIVRESKSD